MSDLLFETLLNSRSEGPVDLDLAAPASRFNLRVASSGIKAASDAFGVALPKVIGKAANLSGREAICIGPDEWVLWAPESDCQAIEIAFADIYDKTPHSLVNISEREIGVRLEGAQAHTLLTIGCPADLSTLSIGEGARTIFDSAQVVVVRKGEDQFQMEVWRSFLPHVWDLLNTGNRELATGL